MRKYLGDKKLRQEVSQAKRIVVKIGTSNIVYENTGKPNYRRIELLARTISDLSNKGKEIILVSSGAIGIGKDVLGLNNKLHKIEEKQAIAAVGQCELMYQYSKFFGEYSHKVGQILLTSDTIKRKNTRKNIINTINELLKKKIIPIVNENDSVAVEEIKIGDNDNLSASVAKMISADLLIVLSDIDGFFESDPRHDENSRQFKLIEEIDKEIEICAGKKGTLNATGGMITKLQAAKTCNNAGIDMVLANGEDITILYKILEGNEIGTLFTNKKCK